jgi:ferredoxin-NADP reductase
MPRVTVTRKELVADRVVALTLESIEPAEPGSHIDLHLPGGLIRPYSLCDDRRIAVLREENSRGGSAYIHDVLAEGDELEVSAPRNHFQLVPAERYIFIAGGIGITPILPMLRAPMLRAAKAPWQLHYGGRSRAAMAFLGELPEGALPARDVTIWPQDERGPLPLDAILSRVADGKGVSDGPGVSDGTAVYCCGPEPLLRTVEARVPPWALHVERFRADPSETPSSTFEVELASSGRVLTVDPDATILQTLRKAGLEVLSSCEEGTCGTCETGVLSGVPDHRDTVLTPAERDAGDIMMLCVSRAKTPRLVLDL